MNADEQIKDLREKLARANDERVREGNRAYDAERALTRVQAELAEVQFHRTWNLRLGVLLLLVLGVLGVRRAVDGRARGDRARANAERVARVALAAAYPGATVTVTCRESNGGDPNCLAIINGVRLTLWCDDDEPRANDGCVVLP